jgi:hypothetical protein
MTALEGKHFFSMFLNFDVLKHRWFFTNTSNTSIHRISIFKQFCPSLVDTFIVVYELLLT